MTRLLLPIPLMPLLLLSACLLSACAPGTSPGPSASASASAPPANSCLREDGGCLGVLVPGEYESASFTTFGTTSPGQLAYRIDDDFWANALDHTPAYWFQPAVEYAAGTGDDFLPGVYVWGDAGAALQEFPACPETSDPLIPTDAASLGGWITALPGAVVTPLDPLALDGRTAIGMDVVMDSSTAQKCSWGAFVPLFASRPDGPDAWSWGIGEGERMHVYLVDLGEGHTAAVIIDAPQASFDTIQPHAEELISTFAFSAS